MMNVKTIGRAAAACAVSGGLLTSGVLPAANAHASSADYGWVKVCQYIDHYDQDYDYYGRYGIKDSYGHNWYFTLGDDDHSCYKKRVRVGYVDVYVHDYPEHADYEGSEDSCRFKVRKDQTYVVSFRYDNHDDERAATA
jgi:hypothetical protein